jgi:CheY-like chemotaxis protein
MLVDRVPHPTILVVDDERLIRQFIAVVLADQPFQTLFAESGASALAISRNHPGPIHLLLSDVTMPGMDGVTLYGFLAQERPETALLLMSGNVMTAGLGSVPMLPKPFKARDLLLKIQHTLSMGMMAGTDSESYRSVTG